jgi:hypothetical protein
MRLRKLTEFVDYMRGELTDLFASHDPQHAHEHTDPAEMAEIRGPRPAAAPPPPRAGPTRGG